MLKIKFIFVGVLFVVIVVFVFVDYLEKFVSFVVFFLLGDLEDVLMCMIVEDFEVEYGVVVVVVNCLFDGGLFLGVVLVVNVFVDGYMIGLFVVDVFVVGLYVGVLGLNFDLFELLGIFLIYLFVIVVSVDKFYVIMEELVV